MEIVYADEVEVWASFFEPAEFAELTRLVQVLRQPFPDPQAIIVTHWQPRLVATAEFVTGLPNVSIDLFVVKFFMGFALYLFLLGGYMSFYTKCAIIFVF